MKSNLASLYLEINITVPSLSVVGNYSLDGIVLGIFPLEGGGGLSAMITGLKTWTKAIFQLGSPMKFTELLFDMSFQTIKVHFDQLLGGGQWITYIQSITSFIGPILFNKFKPKIMKELNGFALKKINEELAKNPTIAKILGPIG